MEVIKRDEEIPAEYPRAPLERLSFSISDDAANALWARIEAYTSHRWTPRHVTWIVEGHGDWFPDLAPLEITSEEIWLDGTWVPATVFASPYGGYRLTQCGTYRFQGIAGQDATIPAEISEAFRRLAEYSAESGSQDCPVPGATNYSMSLDGAIQESFSRQPTWAARALQNSGAADLLRNYRRV